MTVLYRRLDLSVERGQGTVYPLIWISRCTIWRYRNENAVWTVQARKIYLTRTRHLCLICPLDFQNIAAWASVPHHRVTLLPINAGTPCVPLEYLFVPNLARWRSQLCHSNSSSLFHVFDSNGSAITLNLVQGRAHARTGNLFLA